MVFSSVVDNATSDGTVVQPQLYVQGSEPLPPDPTNVCDLGRCAEEHTIADECDTFMDQCLTDGGFADAQCVVGGFYLCHRDDVPEDLPDEGGICSKEDCEDDPGLAQECESFLANCPFSSDRRCVAGALFICRDFLF